jgi:hypothetical protein
MTKFTLPHEMKIVEAIAPATDAAGRSSAAVSLKNVGKAYIMLHINQGNAATILITAMQATNIAKAGGKALANAGPIWVNLDTSVSDTLVRAIDGVNYTTDAAVKNKQVIIEVDPTLLDVENGFDCLYFTTGASNVANITQGQFLLADLRYRQSTPPSVIVN